MTREAKGQSWSRWARCRVGDVASICDCGAHLFCYWSGRGEGKGMRAICNECGYECSLGEIGTAEDQTLRDYQYMTTGAIDGWELLSEAHAADTEET